MHHQCLTNAFGVPHPHTHDHTFTESHACPQCLTLARSVSHPHTHSHSTLIISLSPWVLGQDPFIPLDHNILVNHTNRPITHQCTLLHMALYLAHSTQPVSHTRMLTFPSQIFHQNVGPHWVRSQVESRLEVQEFIPSRALWLWTPLTRASLFKITN